MTKLEEVILIFDSIQKTSGKNDKIEIIKENGDNRLFVDMLNFLYNDFIKTGLALTKMNKETKSEADREFTDIFDAMLYVQNNNTGTDQVIANIQDYIKSNVGSEDFLKEFFTKTYKCGITVKSVNKALGKGVVPEFGCQLAHPYEKYSHKIDGDFAITEKLDGHRTIAICRNGNVKLFTRKGHEIEGLHDISNHVRLFAEINLTDNFVLDGEILLDNVDNLPVDELFKATGKELRKKGDKSGLVFHVFDMVSLHEFESGEGVYSYKLRRNDLDNKFSTIASPYLMLVPLLYTGSEQSHILIWSDMATEKGWEGIMVNDMDEPYHTKRTSALLKVKKFYSSDVEVVDVYKGETGTKNENCLGGVVVRFKDFTVNVGSGFSDEERIKFDKNPELIIGKVIEVRYFEETSNENGGKSLRFPTFKGIRYDKTVEDISYES